MRNRTFTKNCRPTFFVPEQTARCCRRSTACPFCWAREALATWQAIDHAFFAGPEALEGARHELATGAIRLRKGFLPRSPGFDLIEWTVTRAHGHLIQDRETGESREPIGDVISELVALRRKPPWKKFGVLGRFETAYLTTRRGRWHSSIRLLLMVPAGYAVPEGWGRSTGSMECRLAVHPRPTRKDVLGAVARACRYPKALLFGKDARAFADLLNARSRRQLSTRAGLFRDSQIRRAGAGGPPRAEG